LDIPLGDFKIQLAKAPFCHNGVNNVEERLGTKGFRRVRLGIDSREDKTISGLEYVIMRFSKEEKTTLEEVIEQAIQGILSDIIL
jgi:PTH1 family peptidyl-tRNA hydrolase